MSPCVYVCVSVSSYNTVLERNGQVGAAGAGAGPWLL